MTIGAYVSKIAFSDGTVLSLNSDDIIVFTGPNNSGKSSALREIVRFITERTAQSGPVLDKVEFKLLGTSTEIERELLQYRSSDGGQIVLPGHGSFPMGVFNAFVGIVGTIVARLFFTYLDTQTRLSLCRATARQNLTQTKPSEPLSILEIDSAKEDEISARIMENFGFGIVLNRAGGTALELATCPKEQKYPREKYHTREYYDWVSGLPKLDQQGDGVRSFTGILLSMMTMPRPLILIDEPEAFLHPPQARAIASFIAGEAGKKAQIFVATHSDDFIRGLLDANSARTKVIRLQRQSSGTKEVNKTRSLERDRVQELWGDAILRTSDVLSGLFHNATVIVEGESDARFLRTILDSLSETQLAKCPDLKFTYGTGVGSIAKIATALRAVEVPVVVILDQDSLCSRHEIEAIVTALGGNFAEMRESYGALMTWLNGTSTNTLNGEVSTKLGAALKKLAPTEPYTAENRATLKRCISPKTSRDRLRERDRELLVDALADLREEQASDVKSALAAYDALVGALQKLGILFYPTGSLEGLVPEDLPKAGWLDRALQRDLAGDTHLENSRNFAKSVIAAANAQIARP